MALLEYERQIFLDALHENGLLITAKGLGLERIIASFLKVYCDPANLVLVLNTSTLDEEFYTEQLEKESVSPLPRTVTNEINATERKNVLVKSNTLLVRLILIFIINLPTIFVDYHCRQNVYKQGGVLFVTSRILVVDLLTERVPVENVTGIIVCRAHKIVESCQEAFILRLYRQKNKKGFIKAFSHTATAFTSGFCHVERTMKNLFVRKLFLWPRFHADVRSAMEQYKVDVVEIHAQLTEAMLACQAALLDLINACIQELKRCTTAVDAEEISLEDTIAKSFDQTIRLQLDPIWHQLGQKTKQLVSDIKTLRLILRHLTQYDCVTFFNMVNSVRTSERTFGQNTGWLFLDAADNLFVHAKSRIYTSEGKQKKDKDGGDKTNKVKVQLEPCPKWAALEEVMAEIADHNKKNKHGPGQGRVLIAAEDDRTCSQIQELLCEGSEGLLARLYNKSLAAKGEGGQTEEIKIKSKKKRQKTNQKKDNKTDTLTLTQMVGEKENNQKEKQEAPGGIQCSSEDVYYGALPDPITVIHPLHGSSDPYSLVRTLQEVKPTYVVLYDPDMEFVRQLEVYGASNRSQALRVYFLMYTGSVEEQRYLTTLRKEKQAFEFLIKEKATMVIPEEREGMMEHDPNLLRDMTAANATVNTRKGGTGVSSFTKKVIVDMREFRSELPSLIHRRGIDIEPVTLEVGDYIITPDICVERKSVSDLIGSLNNGRLYNQCVSMCRYYKRPVLLIEFDANKHFSLQGKYGLSGDVSLQETMSRLSLLTMHFPKLRILWCQSPYATAELFEDLKEGRDQPDAVSAMSVTASEENIEWSDKYNHKPQDMLLRMPGVTSKNYRRIMAKVEDIGELCKLSEDELTNIMGNSQQAKLLWDFLHKDHSTINNAASSKSGSFKAGGKRKR